MKTVLDSTTHKCSHEQIQFASTVAVKTENSESLYKKKDYTLFIRQHWMSSYFILGHL